MTRHYLGQVSSKISIGGMCARQLILSHGTQPVSCCAWCKMIVSVMVNNLPALHRQA